VISAQSQFITRQNDGCRDLMFVRTNAASEDLILMVEIPTAGIGQGEAGGGLSGWMPCESDTHESPDSGWRSSAMRSKWQKCRNGSGPAKNRSGRLFKRLGQAEAADQSRLELYDAVRWSGWFYSFHVSRSCWSIEAVTCWIGGRTSSTVWSDQRPISWRPATMKCAAKIQDTINMSVISFEGRADRNLPVFRNLLNQRMSREKFPGQDRLCRGESLQRFAW